MENKTNLTKNIEDFIIERINTMRDSLMYNKEYRKVSAKYTNLYDKIEKIINDIKLSDSFQDIEAEFYERQIKQAYITGFRDSNIIFNNKILE